MNTYDISLLFFQSREIIIDMMMKCDDCIFDDQHTSLTADLRNVFFFTIVVNSLTDQSSS